MNFPLSDESWIGPGPASLIDSSAAMALPALAPLANEPALHYLPGTEERQRLDLALSTTLSARAELPLIVAGEELRTGKLDQARVPHDHESVLADVHQARSADVGAAIDAARSAWQDWHRAPWTERAAIFLRAAALVAGPYRERLVAATMLDQSKTIPEAEADAACELADFLRWNVTNMRALLDAQPASTASAWNRVEYRPLEGFVYAITPFNFTAIGGHLPTAPALMGNTVLWKPSAHATLGAALVMEVLAQAGLPAGVINLVYGDPTLVSDVALASPHLAGIHFTGSSAVLRTLSGEVGARIDSYRSLPRIVGEAGGKDFLLAHPSASVEAVANAISRGGFEYQGQKCSAISRAYLPRSLWGAVSEQLREEVAAIEVGDVTAAGVTMGAVINERALSRHRDALAEAESDPSTLILIGGEVEAERGWFVHPTVIETTDPGFRLLRDELFGPIVTVFVYPDGAWEETLDLVDRTSAYALTGSVYAEDRAALNQATDRLRYAAGNLYLNDKPTGAVVGQQPFGGSRGSGTNDKTGTTLHLSRWTSPRTVKESHLAPWGIAPA